MRNLIGTLLLGAAALALTSTAARADHDEWREHAHEGEWRGDGEHFGPGWRCAGQDQRELGRAWRELAEARERFYATWGGNPWRRAWFERWYGHRREELARWSEHERRERGWRQEGDREEGERDGREEGEREGRGRGWRRRR